MRTRVPQARAACLFLFTQKPAPGFRNAPARDRRRVSIPLLPLGFEVLACGLLAVCLVHAGRRSRYLVAELLVTVVYGVILEALTLRQLGAYDYGPFALVVDGAPVAVGIGWGVITYSAMAFSDGLDMPDQTRPLLDGLFALSVDLSMDAIAIRLGMWHWVGVAPDAQWFGVPWVNFWAWLIVVVAYSASLRAMRPWRRYRRWGLAYPVAAAGLALAVLAIVNHLYNLVDDPPQVALAGLLIAIPASVWMIVRVRPRPRPAQRGDRLSLAIPLAFHLLFALAGLAGGIFLARPILAVVSLTILGLTLGLHAWTRYLGTPR